MKYDLIIVGSGLVGAGLACALSNTPLQIALIDAKPPSHDDPRLFGLTHSSCQFLTNLGIWPSLKDHATPIHQVHVSYQKQFGMVRLNCEDAGLDNLGHVIPAYVIEKTLNHQLTLFKNITLYRPALLTSLTQHHHHATLVLNTETGEKTIESPLVIGADGTESTVRSHLKMATTMFDYGQSAMVTRTTLNRPHHYIAYERFTNNGAIAMLPLINQECATIWTADHETIHKLLNYSDDVFLQALQKEFGYRLGRLQKITHRHVFPLRMVRAENAVENNVLLLGNAAHTLHPIAAQGFNLALYEVASLVDAILSKINNHETFSATDLHVISQQTQKQQTISIGLSHRLSQFFSNDSPWIKMGLQLGMIGLDIITPMKRKFIKEVMGKAGRVPHLLMSGEL